jgi:2-methylcitrate dehydratase PrpD
MFDGDITNESFTPHMYRNPRILAFMQKMKVSEDPILTRQRRRRRPHARDCGPVGRAADIARDRPRAGFRGTANEQR